jgi:hypothetical protein
MENLMLFLMQTIANGLELPNLVIDEDCGQLDAIAQGLDQYPVTFPCVLIGDSEVVFRDVKEPAQRGTLTMTVRLAFDVYDDTRLGSGQEQSIADRMAANTQLTEILADLCLPNSRDRLHRTVFRSYSLPHGVKVYETVYQANVTM